MLLQDKIQGIGCWVILLMVIIGGHVPAFSLSPPSRVINESPKPIVAAIIGAVFEDLNYGGGAGRNRNTAILNGGTGRPNARVELYDAGGNFFGSTLTNASGVYTFAGLW